MDDWSKICVCRTNGEHPSPADTGEYFVVSHQRKTDLPSPSFGETVGNRIFRAETYKMLKVWNTTASGPKTYSFVAPAVPSWNCIKKNLKSVEKGKQYENVWGFKENFRWTLSSFLLSVHLEGYFPITIYTNYTLPDMFKWNCKVHFFPISHSSLWSHRNVYAPFLESSIQFLVSKTSHLNGCRLWCIRMVQLPFSKSVLSVPMK